MDCTRSELSKRIWGKVAPSYQDTAGPWENVYRTFQVNSVNRAQFVRNATNLGSDPTSTVEELRDIVGPYRLKRRVRSETMCAYDTWASEALALALADGVPLSLYTQYSFVLPSSRYMHSVLCRWSGLAHVGCGFQCKSWISECASLGVFAHELGHNAGLSHSGSWWSFAVNGQVEYGDPTAIMGNQWGSPSFSNNDFYFAASQRAILGWMPSSQYASLSARQAPSYTNMEAKRMSGSLNEDNYELVDEARDASFIRDNVDSIPRYPAPNRFGVIFNQTHYRLTSPSVTGEKITNAKVFHRDGSYFKPSTARIFRLTPHHVENVESSGVTGATTFKALRIQKMMGTAAYWFSFQVGRSVLAQAALVHLSSPLPGTQTYIVKAIVPYYTTTSNISMSVETTVFYDQDTAFAVRVLRTSETNMDLQVTWECEFRAPLLEIVATPPSTDPLQSSSSHIPKIDFAPSTKDNGMDLATIMVTSTSRSLSFTLNIANMDSDVCRPAIFEFDYEVPPQVNLTCSKPSVSVSPGESCFLTCEVSFIHGLPESSINITTRQMSSESFKLKSTRTTSVAIVMAGCQKALPSLAINHFHAIANGASPAVFQATIGNMDSEGCSPRAYSLATFVGEGWTVKLDKTIPMISPGKSFTLGVQVSPTLSNLAVSSNYSTTFLTVIPHGKDEHVNLASTPQASILVEHLNPCVRSDPLLEMENFQVAFHVRNAAIAPVRVTNKDSISCPPLSVSLSLVPDPMKITQSAFYPSSIVLNPGEFYDFPLVVTTPDFGPAPGNSFRTLTDIELVYERPTATSSRDFGRAATQRVVKTYRQSSWTVDDPCAERAPAMLFSCPQFISLQANTKVVTMPCNIGFRNNDPFQCLSTKFNFSAAPVILEDSEMLNGTVDAHQLIGKVDLSPSELNLVAGVTVFGSALVELNLTGLFATYYNTTSSIEESIIKLSLTMEDIENPDSVHTQTIETAIIKIGLCAIREPATIFLSPNTGPYTWIEIINNETVIEPSANPVSAEPEPMMAPNQNTSDFLPVEDDEPAESVSERSLEMTASYPMLSIPYGTLKAVNFTIFNPMTRYCSRLLFSPQIHPDSERMLKSLGIAYNFKGLQIEAQKSDNATLELKLPSALANLPSGFSGLVNITTRFRWALNASRPIESSPWTTLLLNLTGDCTVRKTQVQKLDPSSLNSPNGTTVLDDMDMPYFNATEPVTFWTIINLTNADSPSCGLNFWNVPSLFIFSARRSWPTVRFPFSATIRAIEIDGRSTPGMPAPPYTIAAEKSQLFNLSIIAPSTLDPGYHSVEIIVTTSGRPEHTVSFPLRFRVFSPPPAPPFHVKAVEVTNSFGVSIGHDILWTACERPTDCICPCKFHIHLNGELVDTIDWQQNHYYAHRYSISQAGVYTTASVVVEDYRGRTSTPYSCESRVSYIPSDSRYAHLFILLVVIGVIMFPTFIIFMEWLRHKNRLPLSNLDFDGNESEDEHDQPSP